jgi:hypothetical protein
MQKKYLAGIRTKVSAVDPQFQRYRKGDRLNVRVTRPKGLGWSSYGLSVNGWMPKWRVSWREPSEFVRLTNCNGNWVEIPRKDYGRLSKKMPAYVKRTLEHGKRD